MWGSGVLKTSAEGSLKKPYEKPILRAYGDIRVMTQTSRVQMGNKDKLGGIRKTA